MISGGFTGGGPNNESSGTPELKQMKFKLIKKTEIKSDHFLGKNYYCHPEKCTNKSRK